MATIIRIKPRTAGELHENAKKGCKQSKTLLKLIEDMMPNDDDDDEYNERDDDDMDYRDGDNEGNRGGGGAGRYGRSRYGR